VVPSRAARCGSLRLWRSGSLPTPVTNAIRAASLAWSGWRATRMRSGRRWGWRWRGRWRWR
jgi:hypothetical protein